MPKNKDFFNRISIIDECLRRRNKRWLIEELLTFLNEKLSTEYDKSISLRTLYGDLKYLQEEKDAPIEKLRKDGKVTIGYSEDFSLKNISLYDDELILLKDAVSILRQVGGLSIVQEIDSIIAKLENTTAQETRQTFIQFERHTISSGSNRIDDIFSAIKEGIVLAIEYLPFSKEKSINWIIHPYLLKEYRNRWFLLGRKNDTTQITTIALDRIKNLKTAKEEFIPNNLFDAEILFNNVIGVTIPNGEIDSFVLINVAARQVPYILTKPIHSSQKRVQSNADGSIQISLSLINNYELRSLLLSYGSDLEVVEPLTLREQMRLIFEQGYSIYQCLCK